MATINEILTQQQLPTMRQKLGARPVRSNASVMSEMIQTPDNTLGYVKGGNLLSAIMGGLKSGLGFYGARQDRKAQEAYNQELAEQAAQERADRLAQQAYENDYKDRQLTQQAELAGNQLANQRDIAQMNIDAQEARAKEARANALYDAKQQRQYALEDMQAKQAQEQSIYDRNRKDALADLAAKQEYEKALATQNKIDAQNAELLKNLDAVMQKKLNAEDYSKWRQNPDGYDIISRSLLNPARWFGSANIIEQKNNAQANEKTLNDIWGK